MALIFINLNCIRTHSRICEKILSFPITVICIKNFKLDKLKEGVQSQNTFRTSTSRQVGVTLAECDGLRITRQNNNKSAVY